MAMQRDHSEEEEDEEFKKKNSNALPLWGNEKTMNLNSLLLTNIQSSHYFKVNLFEFKTYHEVIDEIYYKVNHLEPWEKGSRKTAGQTGMCGGVRGVGVGGIVSTAFSCLYKLFTLRLTRKQINGLLHHADSPYLRGLGFMYLRYTQPPADLWSWFDPYMEDEEMIDVKAGGGEEMMIGVLVRKMLTKLDWYGTLFPRIPVPIQMKIQKQLQERFPTIGGPQAGDARRSAPADDSRRRPPPGDRPERENSPHRERQRPPRDIAEEIALEKERIRREREGSRGMEREDSRGMEREGSRGREREGSRGREREGSRGRDRPASRSRDLADGRGRDHRDGREHREHRDGREHREHRDSKTRDHRDSKTRDHRDSKTRQHRDSKTREHQDDRRREQRSREREGVATAAAPSRERRHRRSRSRDRHAGSRKERTKRSGSHSRERRKRSRSGDRDRHRDERRHRRSGSRERRP